MMVDVERELIDRGYRILYRTPGSGHDFTVWTYQVQRGEFTGGFRAEEEVLDRADPAKLVDKIEKECWQAAMPAGWIRSPRKETSSR